MRKDGPAAQGGQGVCMADRRIHGTEPSARRCERRAGGFSLVELMAVLSISILLMGLLMPTISRVRENAQRVVCASNQRQLGQAIMMYADDRSGRLPHSAVIEGEAPDPRDLLVSWRPENVDQAYVKHSGGKNTGWETWQGWEGLGLLFRYHYFDSPEGFYCPSHRGENPWERYAGHWHNATDTLWTNYHYAGHRGETINEQRTLRSGERQVLVTDGLRRADDFSHRVGMNVLRGDGSVRWRDDVELYALLPRLDEGGEVRDRHIELIWNIFKLTE